jgi:hypothetical protein
MTIRALTLIVASVLTLSGSAAAQAAPGNSGSRLTLRGLDGREHEVTAKELGGFAHVDTSVDAHDVNGRYGGVSLVDLLSLVGAPRGDSLRGKALTTYIVVQASDGYRVVFSLAELAPGFTDRIAILADSRNGAPLSSDEGPYRLIVPDEKRPARWARQVVRIELRSAAVP